MGGRRLTGEEAAAGGARAGDGPEPEPEPKPAPAEPCRAEPP